MMNISLSLCSLEAGSEPRKCLLLIAGGCLETQHTGGDTYSWGAVSAAVTGGVRMAQGGLPEDNRAAMAPFDRVVLEQLWEKGLSGTPGTFEEPPGEEGEAPWHAAQRVRACSCLPRVHARLLRRGPDRGGGPAPWAAGGRVRCSRLQ